MYRNDKQLLSLLTIALFNIRSKCCSEDELWVSWKRVSVWC